jgi:hypothetical protein
MNKPVVQFAGALLLAFATIFALEGIVTVARYPPHSVKYIAPLALVSALLIFLGIRR